MKFTLETIGARLPDLLRASRRNVLALEEAIIRPGEIHGLSDSTAAWEPIRVGDRWGEANRTFLIRVPLRIPSDWTEGKIVFHAGLGQYEDLSGPEALVYLDGTPFAAIDFFHREVILTDAVQPGGTHELVLETHSGRNHNPHTLIALELARVDPEAEALYHDLRVLHDAILTMPVDSVDRARLTTAIEGAYRAIDLRQPHSDAYLQSVKSAREIVRAVYGEANSSDHLPHTVAVGHAHIDLAWLWPVSQTRRKGARTFSTVLRLMEQYPDYRFMASQPALYQMVKEDEPGVYAQVLERIRQGRWEATGASWVEMDCNLVGSESLVRQFLIGKRHFREELGVDPRILWLPDVFGYSAALPQVLKGCDVDYFMTTKISWNEYNRLPYDTFRWRGIDGTEILAHMVTAPINTEVLSQSGMLAFYTYNGVFSPVEVAGNWSAYRQKAVNDELLYLFGYGDGGGGPTPAMQETAARLRCLPGFSPVQQGDAESFFERLRDRVWDNPELPTWVGELYLEYHRGTYTSQAWIKRANRMAELLYREAELWSAMAGSLLGGRSSADRQARLTEGWKRILFNQFHDILPGSSIHQVYVDARGDFEGIHALGGEIRDAAIDDVVSGISISGPALAVFNPAPFTRDDPVVVPIPPGAPMSAPVDEHRAALPVQVVEASNGQSAMLIGASAPPLGYATYSVSGSSVAASRSQSSLRVQPNLLENQFFRLELDERATIRSLIDKRTGREVVSQGERGNQLIAFEDRPINWDAWDIQINYGDKPYPIDDVSEWRVVEEGPLRAGVEIVRRYGGSVITQRILLHRDVPRIDFPTHVDWHERQTLLKVAFPVSVNSARATFDIQWGNLERPTHWNTSWDWARFETCAHKWVDLSEGDYGVSLLNDCKYGHDIKGHVMRLTLIKSPISPDPEADQGEHVFSYALVPHSGDWRTDTIRQAYLFNMPQVGRFLTAGGTGTLPPSGSLVCVDRPGVVIETVKPAEDDDGIIVRFHEAHNSRGPISLTFARPIASAEETNMLEERLAPVEIDGASIRTEVRPYGITTLRVRLSDS